mgnify:CR=1 FL=1
MKNWKEENNGLEREFEFKNFVEVKIRLSTHDQGNTITEKDKKLAEEISALMD